MNKSIEKNGSSEKNRPPSSSHKVQVKPAQNPPNPPKVIDSTPAPPLPPKRPIPKVLDQPAEKPTEKKPEIIK